MATFFNQATLTYNNNVTSSNIVSGELLEVLTATKTAVPDSYRPGDAVTREEFLSLIEKIEGEDGADYIRTMVAFFFEAVKQGDKPAIAYCDRMATRGAQLISALASQMNFGDGEVEVVLSGSINVKLDNKYYLDALLSKAESMSGKKLKFVKLEAMPVTGCINWIMQDYAN